MTHLARSASGRATGLVVALLAAAALVGSLLTAPANATEDPGGGPLQPFTLDLVSPPATYAGQQALLAGSVVDALGQPVPEVPVLIERFDGLTWRAAATVTSDLAGRFSLAVTLGRSAPLNRFRASLPTTEGEVPDEVTVALRQRRSTVTLTGPARVVDERSVALTARWVADSGEPVAGRVAVQRQSKGGGWTTHVVLTTGADGRASLRVGPRQDTRWRAVATPLDWVAAATSAAHRLDNVPPGVPVVLPRKAPKPRVKVPVQPRAVGAGANPKTRTIPAAIWRKMVGRTWHSGCPVGRSSLRLIEVNYWDYSGYRRRGQLVVNADVAAQIVGAMSDLYRHRIPLRSLVRPDRFGWSKKLRGANDYRSMAAGNSSAFNCRDVVGRPGIRSPHAWGRSIDLNPWENPFRSAQGVVPNTWWIHRSHPRYAWRSKRHVVVRILKRHGIQWTYGLGDTHHFDAVPRVSNGRAVVNPTPVIRCGVPVCD